MLDPVTGQPIPATRATRFVFWLLLTLVLAYGTFSSLKPVSEADFWWHLKTGELILATRALPAVDPFAYTSVPHGGALETFLLRSYWLYQVVLALAVKAGGLHGAITLRLGMVALMFAAVWMRLRRLNVHWGIALLLVAVGFDTLAELYEGDRPQLASFLGATLLLGMFERIRGGERPSLLLLPLMILWANLHGGFVIGGVLLA